MRMQSCTLLILMKMVKTFLPLLLLLVCYYSIVAQSLPLSTKSKWIIDDSNGERVKMKCSNWAAHLKPMLPEGLHKRPLSLIARHMSLMGFNCVRLTYATYMFTRHSNLTVVQSLDNLGLKNAIKGMQKNNPQILTLTVVEAQRAVIDELSSHGVMVFLDNQVSKPLWCCGDNDGNGFFGDEFFDPEEWLHGLRTVAEFYKNTSMVVGMSLRNELRGPGQNDKDWYKYVRKGAKTIHKANPNVLVLISGLDYDLDFTPLKTKPLGLHLNKKLVYETHRYAFTEGQDDKWLHQPINKVCKSVIEEVNNKTGFLRRGPHPTPLFVTEFGIDQRGTNQADNLFMSCYLSYLAEMDLDWVLWAFQGSYYLRQGEQDTEEMYGMLDGNWTNLRSPKFHERLQLIQRTIQDPKSKGSQNKIMFHPLSGRCIRVDNKQVHASDCISLDHWTYGGDGTQIQPVGTSLCLRAVGEGVPVTLSSDCYNEQSAWRIVSGTKLQIANKDDDGNNLCLDWDPNYSSRILTKKCICADDDDTNCLDDPQSQWFQLISTNAN